MSSHDLNAREMLLDSLQLSRVNGIGPRLLTALLQRFDSPACVLTQSREALLEVDGLGPAICERILRSDRSAAQSCLKRCELLGVSVLLPPGPKYPAALKQIPDPPGVLYCRGDLRPQDALAVGIVGSRRCSPYGIRQATRLAGALARTGFTVVSGLARGIDAAAHRAALDAGGRTLAVLATGVEHIYPPEHDNLAAELMEHGALLSECPPDQTPRRGMFPQRNRIISGLCQAVVVVEATKKSGALHTVRHAMEQGREVGAVPGPVDSLTSEGCHRLIRDGVTLVQNIDDILEQLGPLAQPARTDPNRTVHHPRETTLNLREAEILNAIGNEATSIDDVVRATRLPPSRVLATLTVLEMRRFIRRLPGSQVVRT